MCFLLPVLLLFLSPVAGNSLPRLKQDLSGEIKDRAPFEQAEEFATTLRYGSTVYVGGNGALHRINFDDSPTLEKIKVPGDPKECQGNNLGFCGNYITILHKFNETHLFVCGTNWKDPRCWLFCNNEFNAVINGNNIALGPGICPTTPQQGSASVVVENRLYSAALSDEGKMHLNGYRKDGNPSLLVSAEEWMNDPKFVGMAPVDELIYMFFSERNLQATQDVDPWLSRVARVCKNDQGGSRQRLLGKWATFLKARLLCNMPVDSVHFNRIEDVFIYKSPLDSERRVYGVFSSNWNGTAVCVYSMKEIDDVFGGSAFKDFRNADPKPGQCVKNTKTLPDPVLSVVENHPEVELLIHSIGNYPLMTNYQSHFKKIVVDSVVGPKGNLSRVLFLAMGDGKIQKILETSNSAFIIAQLTLSKESGPILSMSLDSDGHSLYVTTAKELVRFPVAQCEKYNGTCEPCVQARDPYCGWDYRKQKCVPVTPDSKNVLQDLERGDGCPRAEAARLHSSRRETLGNHIILPLPMKEHVPMYLSCPKQSYHADYFWTFEGSTELPCSWNDDDCLLFIREVSKDDFGSYECISNERGVKQHHAAYLIQDSGGSSVYLSSVALYSVLMAVIWHFLQ